jgi:hypothetical protein
MSGLGLKLGLLRVVGLLLELLRRVWMYLKLELKAVLL